MSTPSVDPPGVRVHVDPWDPGYGAALSVEAAAGLEESTARLDLEFELPVEGWGPLTAPGTTAVPDALLVVDGVRRIEARVWFDAADLDAPAPGLAASWAAGVVRLNGVAEVLTTLVRRGVFSGYVGAVPLHTAYGSYAAHLARDVTPEALSLALQQQLAEAELAVSTAARAAHPDGLLLLDGPLRGRAHLTDAVGYIKTHAAAYLPADLNRIVGSLRPSERTPVFTIGTSWSRHTWYLRLPGGSASPWSGVVRCECSVELTSAEATALADMTSVLLPRLASSAHKDPRAPQNLIPIGGLEHHLRHQLGDSRLLHRALVAATT